MSCSDLNAPVPSDQCGVFSKVLGAGGCGKVFLANKWCQTVGLGVGPKGSKKRLPQGSILLALVRFQMVNLNQAIPKKLWKQTFLRTNNWEGESIALFWFPKMEKMPSVSTEHVDSFWGVNWGEIFKLCTRTRVLVMKILRSTGF